jgi:hypothetical protein
MEAGTAMRHDTRIFPTTTNLISLPSRATVALGELLFVSLILRSQYPPIVACQWIQVLQTIVMIRPTLLASPRSLSDNQATKNPSSGGGRTVLDTVTYSMVDSLESEPM